MIYVDYIKGGKHKRMKVILDMADASEPSDLSKFGHAAERLCEVAGFEFVQAVKIEEMEVAI